MIGNIERNQVEKLFPASTIANIERDCGIEQPDDQFRHYLAEAIWKYLYSTNAADSGRAGAQRQLKALQVAAGKTKAALSQLIRATSGLTENGDTAISYDPGDLSYYLDLVGGLALTATDLEEVFNAVSTIEASAARALTCVKKGKGRPADVEWQMLLFRLANLYERVSGKVAGISRAPLSKEIGGPFFRMVQAVDGAIARANDTKPRNPRTLGESVDSFLGTLRKKSKIQNG